MNNYDDEVIARGLGFESAEEMEKYYDLCRGDFKTGVLMTKELCAKHVHDQEWEHLLNASKGDRLETKLFWDFGGLVEGAKGGISKEELNSLKSLIDFELDELDKYYAELDRKEI